MAEASDSTEQAATLRVEAEADGSSPLQPEIVELSDTVAELRLSLEKPRSIRVVGRDRRGERVERLLRVTDKGKLLLV